MASVVERVIELIDAGIDRRERATPPWAWLSPTSLGDCDRRTAFEFFEAVEEKQKAKRLGSAYLAPQKFPPRLLRVFRDGRTLEEAILNDLSAGGFEVVTGYYDATKDAHRQHGFSVKLGKHGRGFSGRVDGIIVRSPVPEIATPCIVDVKTMDADNFASFKEKGVGLSHPKYVDQLTLYMGLMNITNPSMLFAYNKNTGDEWFELVEFSQERFDALRERVMTLANADGPEDVPRGGKAKEAPPCRWCRFADRCWASSDVTPEAVARLVPSWAKPAP